MKKKDINAILLIISYIIFFILYMIIVAPNVHPAFSFGMGFIIFITTVLILYSVVLVEEQDETTS